MHATRRLRATLLLVAAASGTAGCAGNDAYSRDMIAANNGELDLVETALVVGHCGRFVAAVKRAGLDEMLAGPGPFTVFVPLDQAFFSLATDERHAERENPARLRQVLLHHVVRGEVRAPRLIQMHELTPVEGPPLTISIVESQATVDGANIVRGDIAAKNGVLHFVDRVLLPEPAAAPDDK